MSATDHVRVGLQIQVKPLGNSLQNWELDMQDIADCRADDIETTLGEMFGKNGNAVALGMRAYAETGSGKA